MNLFQTFTVEIARIGRGIQQIKDQEMNDFGLKGLHVSCLYYIYNRRDGITFKELCELCNEDKASVSRSLAQLKNVGYIKSVNDEGKTYKNQLILTQKGKVIAAEFSIKVRDMISEIRKNLDPEEEQIFYKVLLQISENIDRICQNYDS